MDNFLINLGIGHPPIWMLWALIIRVPVIFVYRYIANRHRWTNWGAEFDKRS